LRIEVLGPLRVSGPGEIELRRGSHRRLLSILALDANRRIETDVLIERLWGEEPPATARATLQMHISALRKILPADVIVTESQGYRLTLDGHVLDAEEYQAFGDEAHRAALERDWELALASADSALDAWRGEPYPDLADYQFARPEVRRLEELHLSLLELRTEALLELGRAAEALPDLEQLVIVHPLRERLWENLMRARYRLGRHAEALDAYRQAWTAFAEIGLEPSAALRRLEREILLHDEALTEQTPNNLPHELTPFVGREGDVAQVRRLLDEHRLVTLAGVGGGGKTRLALRAAAGLLDSFPDGCWLAELAPVGDPKNVPLEVARAIGVRARSGDAITSLVSAISSDRALIVLDNCEHLLGGAAALTSALLDAGPQVKVLATSREPLRVPGEVVFDVPPLPYPATDDGEPLEFDAVRLFDERASRVRPSFTIDDTSGPAVAEICRRLDGIPLAIELAAARVGSLSPETIAERLGDRFRILTSGSVTGPERHQTLGAAFDWSYELLEAAEQHVFSRLSVFQGTFALDAAEQVCAGDGVEAADVVPLVAALVDKSLVSSVDVGTARRYRLLETLREYARDHLEDAGDAERISRRFVEWCVLFAGSVATGVHGAGRWELFERLDAESDNLEAALAAALAESCDAGADALAHALAWHALDRGQLARCILYLRTALERATDTQSEAASRSLLGTALFLSGAGDEAFREATRASDLAAELAPSARNVAILTTCARLHVLLLDRDPRDALPLSLRALRMAEACGDPFALIYARRSLGRTLVWSGDADEGLEHYRSALDLALSTGDRAMTLETYESYFVLLYLHPVARRAEPRRVAEEMLAVFPPEEKRWGRHTPADWLPTVFLQSGEWVRAEEAIARLSTRHLEGWDRTGYLLAHGSLRWMQGKLEDAQSDLDELERLGVDVQWHHEYYPLLADVSADQGRLATVRAVADAYLSVEVHPVDEAKKLGVLYPLARAEIDASLTASEDDLAEYAERARATVATARSLFERFPPLTAGSLQLETPTTYLTLAEAEVSRVTGPEPARWRRVLELVDTAYFRLYAGFRLTEALYGCGLREEGDRAFRAYYSETRRVGADRLQLELEALAARERSNSR
jgi:predicted ATPase/DNA-binding SARP family transcriptional activator